VSRPTPSRPDDPEFEAEPAFEGDAEGIGESQLIGRLAAVFGSSSVRHRVLAPLGFDAAILLTNLITGIIVARALGPAGRGELAATLLVAQIAAWIFSMGSAEAVSFHQSRRPQDGSRLMSSWLLLLIPLTIAGIAVTELVLPAIFAAQTDEAIELARLYLVAIPLIAALQVFNGMLLGEQSFFFYNLTRFVYPVLTALAYAVCWATGIFSVELALIANVGALALALLLALQRLLRRHGLSRPDWRLLRRTLAYGLKAHAGATGSIVNARLDFLILPAFLSAASVGLYSVATNLSSIITTLTGTVAVMALPVAARRPGSARTVILTLQAAIGIGIAIAIPLAALSPFALGLVYGADFEGASTSLRLLLPGTVLQAGALVLTSGLLAANRPLWVSAAILPAAALTIGGLLYFLPTGGIEAAAIVTSVVYAIQFVAMAFLYRRALEISWLEFIKPPPREQPISAGPEPGA
jgi:O-antigen/teichoic acid export membrane protein